MLDMWSACRIPEGCRQCATSLCQAGEDGMGMLKQTVRVSNSKQPDRFFQEEFWVDTEALFSFIGGFLASAPGSS